MLDGQLPLFKPYPYQFSTGPDTLLAPLQSYLPCLLELLLPYPSMNTVYFQLCQDSRDYVRDKPEGNFYQPEGSLKYNEPHSIFFKSVKLLVFS